MCPEHNHTTDCDGCKAFLFGHRPQELPHKCPPPIVHTVDRPVEKIVYRAYPLSVIACALFLIGGTALFILTYPIEKRVPYPVYITRIDPAIQAKLDECKTDWQSDQIEKKLLKAKIRRLEMP